MKGNQHMMFYDEYLGDRKRSLFEMCRQFIKLTALTTIVYIHTNVLKMNKIDPFSMFIRTVIKYNTFSMPNIFKVSKMDLDHTGKSGFISIKAPALIEVNCRSQVEIDGLIEKPS